MKTTPNQSYTFSAYNRAVKHYGLADRARTNRALGIVQAAYGIAAKIEEYHTTITDCDCPDRQFRHLVCKHMRALQIREKATRPEHINELTLGHTHRKLNRIYRQHGGHQRYHSLVNIRYYATKSLGENSPAIAAEIAQKLGMTVQEAIAELEQFNH